MSDSGRVTDSSQATDSGQVTDSCQTVGTNEDVALIDEPPGTIGKIMRKWFMMYVGPAYASWAVKVLVFFVFAAYVAVSIYGISILEVGMSMESLFAKDSYIRGTYATLRERFPNFGATAVLFFPEEAAWWNAQMQEDLRALDEDLQQKWYTLGKLNGMTAFLSDREESAQGSTPDSLRTDRSSTSDISGSTGGSHGRSDMSNSTGGSNGRSEGNSPAGIERLSDVNGAIAGSTGAGVGGMKATGGAVTKSSDADLNTQFITELQSWLSTSVGSIFADDFIFDRRDGQDVLVSWRVRISVPVFEEATQAVDFMQDFRSLATSYSHLGPVVYNRGFRFSETDLVIKSQTVFGMVAAFIAVALVSLVVLRTTWSAVLVMMMIFLVDLGLLGFMPLVGVELNMITMVTLIMSIGFSVDYTLHVVHAFTDCVGPTRRNRMIETLLVMGVAVTNGCVSTFLGILPLCWRLDEYMHMLFFKMIALILLFGFVHGLVLLPVLLSIMGPISDPKDHPHPPLHPHLHNQEPARHLFALPDKRPRQHAVADV